MARAGGTTPQSSEREARPRLPPFDAELLAAFPPPVQTASTPRRPTPASGIKGRDSQSLSLTM